MLDAEYFPGTFPYQENPHLHDDTVVLNGYLRYPLMPLNQSMLIEASLITGRPGYDFINPYDITAKQYQTRTPSKVRFIAEEYGGQGHDTTASVLRNVAATGASLDG